jgi:hypothetical protein
MMVILGLGPRQTFTPMMEYVELPPFTIVCPRTNDEKQNCLDGETDTVREENDRVNCEAVNDEPLAWITMRY